MHSTVGATWHRPLPSAADDRSCWIAPVLLCVGTLVIVLDATVVNVALPSIRCDLPPQAAR